MSPTRLVCAIDNGTQSSRCILFDHDLKPVISSQLEYTQHVTERGARCEHDPVELLASVNHVVADALQQARDQLGEVEVVSVGITNQRETTVAWDRATGAPLCNAIVWHDSRTAAVCQAFREAHGGADAFRHITGLPVSTYFSGFKMNWMLDNVPAVAAAAGDGDRLMLGTVDSWLIYNLTGGTDGGAHLTDVTNASRTYLMDLGTTAWHPPLLAALSVPPSALPRICSNAEVFGRVAAGPLAGVAISGCLGDQQAALLGHACAPGDAKNTYGTGCFLLLHTGQERVESSHGLLTTVACQLGQGAPLQFALEGAVATAGSGVTWLRDRLGVIGSPAESETLAWTVADSGGVYFVPAFSGLLAPYWRPDARGGILGLTEYHSRAHIVRAMLDAICFQTREVLDAMRRDAGMEVQALRVDGGASGNDLLMQIQADTLQTPVRRPACQETTALGAALAAGFAVGFWSSEELAAGQGDAGVFEPSPESGDKVERRFASWKKAVQRCLDLDDLE